MADILLKDFFHACIIWIYTTLFVLVGFRLLTGMVAIDIARELREKNVAVGMVVCGMAVCVGITAGITGSVLFR